jgi:general secretion pathway protein B
MSYILDALRKSDLQRQRGAPPTLLAVQDSAVERKRPAFLAYGLLAAVLVGAGMVVGWLRPWQPEQAAPVRPETVAARPLESTPRQPAPATSETVPQPNPEPKLQNATQPMQAAPTPSEITPQPKPKRKPKPKLPARAQPVTDGPSGEADAAATTTAPATEQPVDIAADAADAQAVMSMADLPPSVRQELPAMKISVHAYSANPGGRLVGIDSRILREGDVVVPGLELEEITPDGMIFVYKGYRFHRGVK